MINNLIDIKRQFISNFSYEDSKNIEEDLNSLNGFNPFGHDFNVKLIHDEVFSDFDLEKYLENSLSNKNEYNKKDVIEFITLIDIYIDQSYCKCTYLDFSNLKIVQMQYKKSLYYKFMLKFNEFKEKKESELSLLKFKNTSFNNSDYTDSKSLNNFLNDL